MADSIYVKVGDGVEQLDLGGGSAPEYVERIEALEAFAEEQPLEEMIDGYLMNTAFLSRIPKEKLREMVSLLESRPARSIIEQTNLSLMRSELKVTEAERSGQL